MRKILLIVVVLVSCFIVVGCSREDEYNDKTTKMVHEHCSRNGILNNGSAELTYEIYYTGDRLNRLESKELVKSDDNDLLIQYENAYKSIHEHYKGLEYYDTSVVRDNDTVISTIIINYDKIDISKLIDIEGEEDNIFEGMIPKVSKWKEFAKKVGTKCEVVS